MTAVPTSLVAAVALCVSAILYSRHGGQEYTTTDTVNASYDYVIIGAGSAGAILAARLSEDPDLSVLLLEAGGNDMGDPLLEVPFYSDVALTSHIDWSYFTVPQKHACQSLKDKRSFWPRGRTLGGTSSLNSMVYMRGTRHDYDAWVAMGAEGWSYDEVYPYFLKSEKMMTRSMQDPAIHATDGEIKVTNVATTDLAQVFLRGGKELGYNINDCNANNTEVEGFGEMQSTVGDGYRSSTARGFLLPAANRANLHVSVDSHVTKVNIKDKRAVGVSFVKGNRKRVVKADKEVIVSAGAVGSPQILLLSGVGPKKHLKQIGIPLVADLPVGENLQDHLFLPVTIDSDQPHGLDLQQSKSLWTKLQYRLFGTGYLAYPGMREAAAFVRVDQDSADQCPDIQYQLHCQRAGLDERTPALLKSYSQEAQEMIRKNKGAKPGRFAIGVMGPQHPKSKGTVRLASADPFDDPLIDPNYLAEEEDARILAKGVLKLQELIATPSFKAIGARIAGKAYPKCSSHKLGSEDYWVCMSHQLAITNYHPAGTCKMGAVSDNTTVVDPQLRVKGIAGLRVVDASVMPRVTACNTNAPAMMIGEKAADIIRNGGPV